MEENAKKKRGAERQGRREDEDEEETTEDNNGTWQAADKDVIASRRRVKVRRGIVPDEMPKPVATTPVFPTLTTAPTLPVLSTGTELPKLSTGSESSVSDKKDEKSNGVETKSEENPPKEENKKEETKKEEPKEFKLEFKPWNPSDPTPFGNSDFKPMTFGDVSASAAPNSIFSLNIPGAASTQPSWGPKIGEEEPSASEPFEVPIVTKAALPPPEPIKPGEEDEKSILSCKILKCYEFDVTTKAYKEKGPGNLKLNVSADGKAARLIMRADVTHRLIINTGIYPTTTVEKHNNDRTVRFSGVSVDTNLPTLYVVRTDASAATDLIREVQDKKKTVDALPANSTSSSQEKTTESTKTETKKEETNKEEPEKKETTSENDRR